MEEGREGCGLVEAASPRSAGEAFVVCGVVTHAHAQRERREIGCLRDAHIHHVGSEPYCDLCRRERDAEREREKTGARDLREAMAPCGNSAPAPRRPAPPD